MATTPDRNGRTGVDEVQRALEGNLELTPVPGLRAQPRMVRTTSYRSSTASWLLPEHLSRLRCLCRRRGEALRLRHPGRSPRRPRRGDHKQGADRSHHLHDGLKAVGRFDQVVTKPRPLVAFSSPAIGRSSRCPQRGGRGSQPRSGQLCTGHLVTGPLPASALPHSPGHTEKLGLAGRGPPRDGLARSLLEGAGRWRSSRSAVAASGGASGRSEEST